MLLRQVQARPLQGHHLRALRCRGHAAEGAPRAHGPHRPGRAGLAHLVLQGCAEPDRLPARHRPARAREGPVLRRLHRHDGGQRGAGEGPERPRGQGHRRVRADRRRPRGGARRSRGPAQAPPRVLHEGQGAELRRGRRVLGPRPEQLGRGAGHPHARGLPRARRRHVRRRRQPDHDRGLQEDPRARSQLGDPRRPPALEPRARAGRDRRDPDRGGPPEAVQGRRQGDRLQEGRDHQAHQEDRGGAAHGRRARGRRRGARLRRRRQEPREGTGPRQRAAPRAARVAARAGLAGRDPREGERPLPADGREDPEGGSRRARPVGAEGPRDVPRHRVAAR